MKNQKKILLSIITVLILVVVFYLYSSNTKNYNALNSFTGEVQYYKSLSCGCCDLYSKYLSQKGGLKLNIIVQDDISDIKEKYGVPTDMESCHTFIIDNYFVEGHMPLEAINKLIKEKPDIKGITLPGMPAGSPGMPGNKNAKWTVYSVNKDGTTQEFMTI
jgi:hypothetical protein